MKADSPVVWAIFALGIVVLFYALIAAVAQAAWPR